MREVGGILAKPAPKKSKSYHHTETLHLATNA